MVYKQKQTDLNEADDALSTACSREGLNIF